MAGIGAQIKLKPVLRMRIWKDAEQRWYTPRQLWWKEKVFDRIQALRRLGR